MPVPVSTTHQRGTSGAFTGGFAEAPVDAGPGGLFANLGSGNAAPVRARTEADGPARADRESKAPAPAAEETEGPLIRVEGLEYTYPDLSGKPPPQLKSKPRAMIRSSEKAAEVC